MPLSPIPQSVNSLLSGPWVNVKNFGAKGDGVTDDHAAIMNAINSVKNHGGVVFFPATANFYGLATQIQLQNAGGNRYDNIVLMGEGYASQIRPLVQMLGGGGAGPIYFHGAGVPYDLKNCGLMNLRVSGFDATTLGSAPLVSWIFTDGGFSINCFFDTNGDEAVYWDNPSHDQNAHVVRCYFTNVGGWSRASGGGRSAINTNANNSFIIENECFQVGSFVEHTGDGFQIVGNRFDYAAINFGAAYEIGVLVESPGGASGQHGNGTIVGNTISHSELAISVGTGSTGGVLVADNVIYNCDNGINSACTTGGTQVIRGNYLEDTLAGSQGYAINFIGAGACSITENDIVAGSVKWAYGIKCSDATSSVYAARNRVWGPVTTSAAYYQAVGGTKIEFVDNVVMDPAGTIPTNMAIYFWNNALYQPVNFGVGIYRNTRLSNTEPSVMYLAAAPVAGTWKAGDKVINTAPTATGISHWLCTTAGSPGTWTPSYTAYIAGSGISFTGGNTITAPVMVGASAGSAGAAGIAPQPTAGQQGSFLRGDGTWASVGSTPSTPSTLFSSVTQTPSVTTGTIDAISYTMPANTLTTDGQCLRVTGNFFHAANTNATTAGVQIMGAAVGNFGLAASSAKLPFEARLVRTSSTTATINITSVTSAGALLQGCIFATVNYTITQVIKLTVTGAITNGDLTSDYMRVELWP